MSEDIIFDDDPCVNFHVDFGINDEYKDTCSLYNKCSFIKKVLIALPQRTKIITKIEREYYIDYVFDFDDKVINEVFDDLKKNVCVGIQTLKRLKRMPKWATKPL